MPPNLCSTACLPNVLLPSLVHLVNSCLHLKTQLGNPLLREVTQSEKNQSQAKDQRGQQSPLPFAFLNPGHCPCLFPCLVRPHPTLNGKSYPYPGFADEDTKGESRVTGPRSHSQLAVELGPKCQSVGGKLAVRSALWDSVFQTVSHNSPSRCEISLVGRASYIIRGVQGKRKCRALHSKRSKHFPFFCSLSTCLGFHAHSLDPHAADCFENTVPFPRVLLMGSVASELASALTGSDRQSGRGCQRPLLTETANAVCCVHQPPAGWGTRRSSLLQADSRPPAGCCV